MRPRVFIAMHYLELGGAESALIGLLDAWDYDRADIDLFLYAHRGELMRYIPAQVNLLPENRHYASIESPVGDALRRGCLGVVLGRWLGHRSFARFARRENPDNGDAVFAHIGKTVTRFVPRMSERVYDLAISFLTPHFQVLEHVNARSKICWIHTDYSHIRPDVSLEMPMWSAFDHIISISPDVTRSFLKRFPGLDDRIVEIENIMPVHLIRGRAKESLAPGTYDKDTFNILSVGRFTYQKNFDNIPAILRQTIAITGNDNLRWHLIGYGLEEEKIRKAITDRGMENHVIIHGKKENPYPYIAGCDLYVQPSRSEGKSVCVREAQALGRPVVIADYPTAPSQVAEGTDGIILPLDNDRFARGLASVIEDDALMSRLSENCMARDYSNRAEIEKLYSLIPR